IAAIVTAVVAVTLTVLTVNVPLVAPAATVTLGGTVATAVLLLVSVITAPPVGAGPASVIVPCGLLPPNTLLGLSAREDSRGATVRFAVWFTPLYVAVIVATEVVATPAVLIAKVPLVAPAGTVTLGGTVATAVLLLASVISAPPVGAGPANVIVPVELPPPKTLFGLNAREDSRGVTVSVAVCFPPLYVAVIVTAVVVATPVVLIAKVPLVAPAATVTLAGTVATGLLLASGISAPPVDPGQAK